MLEQFFVLENSKSTSKVKDFESLRMRESLRETPNPRMELFYI